jgi:hypothetical protein
MLAAHPLIEQEHSRVLISWVEIRIFRHWLHFDIGLVCYWSKEWRFRVVGLGALPFQEAKDGIVD